MNSGKSLMGAISAISAVFALYSAAVEAAETVTPNSSCPVAALSVFRDSLQSNSKTLGNLVARTSQNQAYMSAQAASLDKSARIDSTAKWSGASLIAGLATGGLLSWLGIGAAGAGASGAAVATTSSVSGIVSNLGSAAQTSIQITLRQLINSTLGIAGTFAAVGDVRAGGANGNVTGPLTIRDVEAQASSAMQRGAYADAQSDYRQALAAYVKGQVAVQSAQSTLLDQQLKILNAPAFTSAAGLARSWNPWASDEKIPAIASEASSLSLEWFKGEYGFTQSLLGLANDQCRAAVERQAVLPVTTQATGRLEKNLASRPVLVATQGQEGRDLAGVGE